LPIILMSAIAGQETANIAYVLDHGAGAWCPQAADAVQTIKTWINEDKVLAEISQNVRQLANPDAVWTIARRVMDWTGQETRT
jgi:UDP-N-acetylglucosamine:LPS N-acetylglucosamine transferase